MHMVSNGWGALNVPKALQQIKCCRGPEGPGSQPAKQTDGLPASQPAAQPAAQPPSRPTRHPTQSLKS
eukprot:7219322-Heterocapsa_arctica.AAC.1